MNGTLVNEDYLSLYKNNNINSLRLFKTLLKSFNKQLVKNEWVTLINNTNNIQPHQIFQLNSVQWTFSNIYPTIHKIRIIFIRTYLSNNLIPPWTNFIYYNFINCIILLIIIQIKSCF